MRLQHVSIPRHPEKESTTRAFYSAILGLSEIPVPESLRHLNVMWFQIDANAELHILVEAPTNTRSNRHFCLVVNDLQKIRQTLTSSGYAVWDAEEIPGRPRFFCHDPSMNIIEFAMITGDYLEFQG